MDTHLWLQRRPCQIKHVQVIVHLLENLFITILLIIYIRGSESESDMDCAECILRSSQPT